ncbi:hypothetical protein BC936DRAFT_142771, partial [Jimgerdemannia flammicorona]
ERRFYNYESQPCLIISRSCLPFLRDVLEELRKHFTAFECTDVYHDTEDWYIVFASLSQARKAYTATD